MSPTPLDARFSWARHAGVPCIGALLWLAPMALLAEVHGAQYALAQMGLFSPRLAHTHADDRRTGADELFLTGAFQWLPCALKIAPLLDLAFWTLL